MVAKIDECSKASEVTIKITILQAIRWISEAWKKVSLDTIKNVLDYLVYWTTTFK